MLIFWIKLPTLQSNVIENVPLCELKIKWEIARKDDRLTEIDIPKAFLLFLSTSLLFRSRLTTQVFDQLLKIIGFLQETTSRCLQSIHVF